MKIYSFFKESTLASIQFPWRLSYKQAAKLIWEKIEEIQKIPGVKILNSTLGCILELSCLISPSHFKLKENISLEVTINEIFKKFSNYETYKEFIKEEDVEENDTDLKNKVIKIEKLLIMLVFNITLLNNFIQKTNADTKALIKIPEFLSFRYFKKETINTAVTQSEKYLMAVRESLTSIENDDNYLWQMSETKADIDKNPFLNHLKNDFDLIQEEVTNFSKKN